jgi:hypothetical protein
LFLSSESAVDSKDLRRHLDWLFDAIENFSIGLDQLNCTFRNFMHSAHEGRISSEPSTCWVR